MTPSVNVQSYIFLQSFYIQVAQSSQPLPY